MSGGSQPSSTTNTTTTTLSPEQRQILDLAMPGVQQYAASVPERYQGTTIAPQNANQLAGQQAALGATETQGNLASAGAAANNNLLTNIWDPSTNPNLQGAVDAAVRPINEQLTRTALPAIRGEAVSTGNFGSSRQGIAEGMAVQGAQQAAGDTASKLVQSQYDTNINAQLKALGLLPSTQSAQLSPAITQSGVGDVQQANSQAALNETVGNFNYDQMAPFLQSQDLMSLLTGLPGGGTTSTGTATGPQANRATGALGGAASGAALGTALMPGIGTGVGAGLGALFSLFG